MNIGFLITPKIDTVWISDDISMRQAMEKMEYHRYSAIPIINKEGKYVGTLTEGDLLWELKNMMHKSLNDLSNVPLEKISRKRDNEAVFIDCSMEEAFSLSLKQGFVPVVDDEGVFIGIILRSSIIGHFIG